jgi:hypothetical protein
MNKHLLTTQLDEVLESRTSRPYIFRTRLERLIIRLTTFFESEGTPDQRVSIQTICASIKNKINYISDKSNQNSEGELNSYGYFKEDLIKLRSLIN